MENEGQIKMIQGNEIPSLTVEQMNLLLDTHKEGIVSKPSFKRGDMVELSDLGKAVGLNFMKVGQRAVVAGWGKSVVAITNDEGRDLELQMFDAAGHFIRVATDSRFVKLVKN